MRQSGFLVQMRGSAVTSTLLSNRCIAGKSLSTLLVCDATVHQQINLKALVVWCSLRYAYWQIGRELQSVAL